MGILNTHAQGQWINIMTLSWLLNISGMARKSSLQLNILCFNIILQLLACSRVQRGYSLEPKSTNNMIIGAVLDLGSLMGKQQKIAMEIAVEEFNNQSSSSKLDLQIKDSHGNSARVIASGNVSSSFFFLWQTYCCI